MAELADCNLKDIAEELLRRAGAAQRDSKFFGPIKTTEGSNYLKQAAGSLVSAWGLREGDDLPGPGGNALLRMQLALAGIRIGAANNPLPGDCLPFPAEALVALAHCIAYSGTEDEWLAVQGILYGDSVMAAWARNGGQGMIFLSRPEDHQDALERMTDYISENKARIFGAFGEV